MDLYYQQAAPAARRPWAKEEDKAFEAALVTLPDHAPDRWERVAARLPGRTPQEAWEHYQALVADVDLIERGAVDTPDCWDFDDDGDGRATVASSRGRPAGKARGEERRRGIPWSEEEHKYVRIPESPSLLLSHQSPSPLAVVRIEILPAIFPRRFRFVVGAEKPASSSSAPAGAWARRGSDTA